MTSPPATRPAVFRWVLAAVALADLLFLFVFIGDAHAIAAAEGAVPNIAIELLASLAARIAIVTVGVAAVVAFALGPGRVVPAAVALVALALLSGTHAQLYGSPWRHLFYSGACLFGWIVGLVHARGQGRTDDESYAITGAVAVLGAAYFNAGLSKLAYGGLSWTRGITIQTAVVGHDGLIVDGPLGALRAWVVSIPAIAVVLSVATIGFELAGPLMLLGRRARMTVALGLIAMHVSILLLTDIPYWEAVVMLALFGVIGRIPAIDERPAAAEQPLLGDRKFASAAGVVAIVAAVAVVHQGLRLAGRDDPADAEAPAGDHDNHDNHDDHGGEPGPPEAGPPEVTMVESLGPFAVGLELGEWSLERIRLEADRARLEFGGGRGPVGFDLTCAASPHESPFDLDGGLHVFYSSELDYDTITPLGTAVGERLTAATAGGPACEQLGAWLQAAAP